MCRLLMMLRPGLVAVDLRRVVSFLERSLMPALLILPKRGESPARGLLVTAYSIECLASQAS